MLFNLRRLKDPLIKLLLLALASLCFATVSMAVDKDSSVGSNLTQDKVSYHSVDEESDLHEEIKILKLQIRNLYNLTENLSRQLEEHINDVKTDKCRSSPCQNSGVCLSENNSFSCICPSGFTGLTCNENVNECESPQKPCENSGECIDEIGGFTCVCPLPFAGRNCQETLDPCRSKQCQNGASCIVSANYLDFVCSCAEGFNGTLCELNIDDCLLSESCQNGGTCVDGINTYTCACAEGYEGRDCGISTQNCAVNDPYPCLNGGTCIDIFNSSSFGCICTDTFSGTHCQNANCHYPIYLSLSHYVNKCRYPGTCAPPSDDENCHRCRDGFVKDPEDDTRCEYAKGNASLIISSINDIKMISMDGLNTTQSIQNEFNVQGTDYNFQTNTIFWFSYLDRNIYTAPINVEAGNKSILFSHDSSSHIDGLAVDWIHHHLYWVDWKRNQLCVTNFKGSMKKVLLNDGFSFLRSIAVNPLHGWMYWSDLYKHRIERAGLDGSRREVILSTNNKYPFGLVVDFVDSRLYWSQGDRPSSIWSCKFDGSDQKLIFTANSSQFRSSSLIMKIATYGKYVFFIEMESKSIYKVNKCNGEELEMIYQSELLLWDIKTYGATLQPAGENLCSKRIGHCSHFCFPVPFAGNGSVFTTTCACPDELSLSADQQNCVRRRGSDFLV